jgi:2-methylcitrate dehydratase PrpD
VGRSRTTSPTAAALANGTYIQAFELNDLGAYVHPGASILPACLAAIDYSGRPVSLGTFLAALAVGYEVTVRISEAVGPSAELEIGWHTPGFHGALGAAASAGALMGFSEDEIARALAIAADIAGGGLMFARLGSDVKRMHAGRASETGVFAALLARAGTTSRRDVIEHPDWGYCRTMTGGMPRYDLSVITADLGQRFIAFDRTAVKYFPVGAEIQGVLDNVNRLKAAHGVTPDMVEKVEVGTTTFFYKAAVHRPPDTISDVHFNIEYGVAMALVHTVQPVHASRKVLDLWQIGYRDPTVRALADRVCHVADEALNNGNPYSVDSRVCVTMRDGRKLTAESDYVAHETAQSTMRFSPMAQDLIAAKFEVLAMHALPTEVCKVPIEILLHGDLDVEFSALWAQLWASSVAARQKAES